MTGHEHDEGQEKTWKEFNKIIDESEEAECGSCFSFYQYKHLNEPCRKLAYLAYCGKEKERVEMLVSEFARLKGKPIDDNIYFMILQSELIDSTNRDALFQIGRAVWTRAYEMIEKKMPNAWVAVRAFGWNKTTYFADLPGFLEKTDDLGVWQVVMQCMARNRLGLSDLYYCRNKVYEYTIKAIELERTSSSDVAAMNGITASMRLLDERALDLFNRFDRSNKLINKMMARRVIEQADYLIQSLTKERQTQYVPTLMELKKLSEEIRGA